MFKLDKDLCQVVNEKQSLVQVLSCMKNAVLNYFEVEHKNYTSSLGAKKALQSLIPPDPIGAKWAGLSSECYHKRFRNKCEMTGTSERLNAMLTSIRRFEFRVDDIDPVNWFISQPHLIKTFWSSRDDDFALASLGEALCFRGNLSNSSQIFKQIESCFSTGPDELKFFGGMRFDERNRDNNDAWSKFGGLRFVLPQFEIRAKNNTTYASLNICSHNQKNELLKSLSQIEVCSKTLCPEQKFFAQFEVPDKNSWHDLVNLALKNIEKKEFDKVVLARKKILKSQKVINADAIFYRLAQTESNAFVFCFHNSAGLKYLGASPERLYKRQKQRMFTEALAGTVAKMPNKRQDIRSQERLLQSQKDRHEQEIVALEIENKLAEICFDYGRIDDKKIFSQKHVHHLRTRFGGILNKNVNDEKILSTLSPTAAVCGFPFAKAYEFLAKNESFTRGCYCGPVGFLGKDESEFAVGIRSALIDANKMYVFGGAGVVSGSKPTDEWIEIENKMKLFCNLFERDSD